MAAREVVQVDDSQVRIALGRFKLSLEQTDELMKQIGASQLVSVRRTFRDQGSPAGSWVPLAASTIRSNPKIYGAGHKMLVRSSRLLNSIGCRTYPGGVAIGTNLKYAAVHQFGSRDRGVGIGPQTLKQSKATVDVKAHSYHLLSGELGSGKIGGRRMKIQGPRDSVKKVDVGAHTRHQNIPPRPYLVFRPEDPGRIRGIVNRYIIQAKKSAGLGGTP